jgi:hypothetical protein
MGRRITGQTSREKLLSNSLEGFIASHLQNIRLQLGALMLAVAIPSGTAAWPHSLCAIRRSRCVVPGRNGASEPNFRFSETLLDQRIETGLLIPSPRPDRGATGDRHVRGAGCGGRGGADNEWRRGGRRSRVVLTPRRWCQVSRIMIREVTGAKKARSPGDHVQAVKPLRGECRMFPVPPL